jgi:hypothetical protein
MAEDVSTRRVLDPIDRVSEVIFALIMVLTFTGSLSVATAGHGEVRAMLVAALGCNLAWGIIDALLYVMGNLAERGRGLAALHALHGTQDPREGQRLVAAALPPVIASVVEPTELEAIRGRLARLPEPPGRPSLGWEDARAGLAVFLLVFVSTLPVVVPFLLVSDAYRALRISNGIAVTMLFVCGYSVGRLTRYHPWATGFGMVLLGGILVSMTMALGG